MTMTPDQVAEVAARTAEKVIESSNGRSDWAWLLMIVVVIVVAALIFLVRMLVRNHMDVTDKLADTYRDESRENRATFAAISEKNSTAIIAAHEKGMERVLQEVNRIPCAVAEGR